MAAVRWILIAISLVAGVFTPWKHQLVIMAVLMLGYACCHGLKWNRYQLVTAYLYGGLATGLGLQFLIAYGMRNQPVPMIVAPLLIWLVLRIVFYGFETFYTLHPNAVVTQMRSEEAHHNAPRGPASTTAWSSEASGQADVPDADGQYLRYDYSAHGEIAMGGPTYGDVIFNNRCAFTGVGPSVVLSGDGRYAAMTLPSRGRWGLLIADLQLKNVYAPEQAHDLWELDSFNNGIISGRYSPLTDNETINVSLSEVLTHTPPQALINDDGWWVMDFPGREPFAHYDAVSIASSGSAHRVLFVPDLKPFQSNPFLRSQHPAYSVLVDDVMLEMQAYAPRACWINGYPQDRVSEGRFLVIEDGVLDFLDAAQDTFSAAHPVRLALGSCDEHTTVRFDDYRDAGSGHLLAKGHVMPRSFDWSKAEFQPCGTTSPWDDETVGYWDQDGNRHAQERTRIQRHIEYNIDLPRYGASNDLRSATLIGLVNRGNPRHTARLMPPPGPTDDGHTLDTHCGVTLQNVMQEAIWSHCGRYLAIVRLAPAAQAQHCITIVDFDSASHRDIPGTYAQPSFIWFDAGMLEFTHLIEPGAAANQAPDRSWNSGQPLAQHCMLFAPAFDRPVVQPHATNPSA